MTSVSQFRFSLFAALLVAIASAGCSSGSSGPPVYRVKGKITMGGGPVVNATVIFSPKEKQPVAMGRTNDQGIYTLTTRSPGDGAAAGDYVVLVSKEMPAEKPAAISHSVTGGPGFDSKSAHGAAKKAAAANGPASLLPEKYSLATESPLKATVKKDGGNDNLDQDLKP